LFEPPVVQLCGRGQRGAETKQSNR
jgi:hypothetical protein